MRKKMSTWVMVFLMCGGPMLFPKKVATLSEVMKPQYMLVEDNRLYISEQSSIDVYSMENFKLVKRIGRKGEGPGEFKSIPVLKVCSDYLFVSDLGRVLYFSREGELLRERKMPYLLIFQLYPVKKNFVGYTARITRRANGTRTLTRAIALFDNDIQLVKDFLQFTVKPSPPGKREIKAFDRYFKHDVYDDKIFVADSEKGFSIEVFDSTGKKLYHIRKEVEKEKVTDTDKKAFIQQRKQWEKASGISQNSDTEFLFNEYFPALRYFTVNNGKIYAVTSKRKDKKNRVIVMDLRGNILKESFITYKDIALYTISNDKCYYLLDNEDTEEWELFAENI